MIYHNTPQHPQSEKNPPITGASPFPYICHPNTKEVFREPFGLIRALRFGGSVRIQFDSPQPNFTNSAYKLSRASRPDTVQFKLSIRKNRDNTVFNIRKFSRSIVPVRKVRNQHGELVKKWPVCRYCGGSLTGKIRDVPDAEIKPSSMVLKDKYYRLANDDYGR